MTSIVTEAIAGGEQGGSVQNEGAVGRAESVHLERDSADSTVASAEHASGTAVEPSNLKRPAISCERQIDVRRKKSYIFPKNIHCL